MSKLGKVILPIILAALIILGLIFPAQGDGATRLTIEQSGVEKQTVTVNVCTKFTIQIWVRDIPYPPYSMVGIDFQVQWDPASMEYIDSTPNDHGWFTVVGFNKDAGLVQFHSGYNGGGPIPWPGINEDDWWLTITFHCLREGTSTIVVTSPSEDTVWLSMDGQIVVSALVVEGFVTTVHQYTSRPVGGVLTPVNKLDVLAPYLALIGLVGAVTVAVAATRRRKV